MSPKPRPITPMVKDYDPSWILEMARKQYPKNRRLLAGLKGATKVVAAYPDCGEMCPYFVDPDSPEWQYAGTVEIKRKRGEPPVLVDMMKDGRVGAIEDGNAWGIFAAREDTVPLSELPPEWRDFLWTGKRRKAGKTTQHKAVKKARRKEGH